MPLEQSEHEEGLSVNRPKTVQDSANSRRDFLKNTLLGTAFASVVTQVEAQEAREREPEVPTQDTMMLFIHAEQCPASSYCESMRSFIPEIRNTGTRGRVGIFLKHGAAEPESILPFNENGGDAAIKRTRAIQGPRDGTTVFNFTQREAWRGIGTSFGESEGRLRRVVLVISAYTDPRDVGLRDAEAITRALPHIREAGIARVDLILTPVGGNAPVRTEAERAQYLRTWETFCRRAGGGSVTVVPPSVTQAQEADRPVAMIQEENQRLHEQLRLRRLSLPATQLGGIPMR